MENISKIVLAKDIAKRIGYVLDVVFDFENLQVVGYCVVDDETESEHFLSIKNIQSISKDFVCIDNVESLVFTPEKKEGLIGKIVVDDKGHSFGTVIDYKIENKFLKKLITDKCEILAKMIKKVGDDIVFLGNKKARHIKVDKKFPNIQSDVSVQIETVDKSIVPEKINLSPSFYIGKVATQNVFGYNNEKIILSGEVINKAVLEKAKKHNKLNQLFFAIKR